MKLNILLTLFGLCAQLSYAQVPTFDAPSAVVWYEKEKCWLVANLGGGMQLEQDGMGWITKLDSNGQLLSDQWLTGFNAITDMCIYNNQLYVLDRTKIVIVAFSKQPSIVNTIELKGIQTAYGISVDAAGAMYVSDLTGNKIVKIVGNKQQTLVQSDALDHPSGIRCVGTDVYVGSWGDINPDLILSPLGRVTPILKVNNQTGAIAPLSDSQPVGIPAGMTLHRNTIYIAEQLTSRVILLNAKQDVVEVRTFPGLQICDVAINNSGTIMAVVSLIGNQVLFVPAH